MILGGGRGVTITFSENPKCSKKCERFEIRSKWGQNSLKCEPQIVHGRVQMSQKCEFLVFKNKVGIAWVTRGH